MLHTDEGDYNQGYYEEMALDEARKKQEEADAKCDGCGKPHDCSEVCGCKLCGKDHAYSNGSAAMCQWVVDRDFDKFVANSP